ncbi:MAG: iron ABC transporter permease [Planctomycetes bacterium]|nr:iron ABC transporter permease [Planctomycetota bacterium]
MRPRELVIGVGLCAAWIVLSILELRVGPGGAFPADDLARGVGAAFRLADPLEGSRQTIVEFRLWRALAAGFVGGALSLSGMMLQGLFRNSLAAPSVIGVTAGASLGAAIAILMFSGYLPTWALLTDRSVQPFVLSGAAFLGALGTAALVTGVAQLGGRVSVPTLLLAGIAVTTSVSGILGAIQSTVFHDFDVVRALGAFTFGSLDDRNGMHVSMVVSGLVLAMATIPFVATELDLMAGGESDARSLGVDVGRTKVLVLGAAVMSAACAVAAAGQIAFLGLIVPHLVRLVVGGAHRVLLPMSVLGGAVFLLATDYAQRAYFGDLGLQPGVVMSLLGGPFFLSLLLRHRRTAIAW